MGLWRYFWYGPGFPATRGLVLTITAVFAVQLAVFFGLGSERMQQLFSLSRTGLEEGAWWQLLTHAWLHSEVFPLHYLLNTWMLFLLGESLERQIGTARFILLYMAGMLASAGLWLWWDDNPFHAVVGASGAIFALLAAYGLLNRHRTVSVIFLIFPLRMKAWTLAKSAILVEAVMMLLNFLPEIAHAAHVGGAVAGLMMGAKWANDRRFYRKDPPVYERTLTSESGVAGAVSLRAEGGGPDGISEKARSRNAVFSSGNPMTLEGEPSIFLISQSPRS
jgi:membrane associated rhomboid family serine protease